MDQSPTTPPTSLYDVLRTIVDQLQRISGAEIVSLYLYDSDAARFYAPVARGVAEDELLASISDIHDQLARYRSDVAQGKAPAPDELHLKHYGPNVWLTVTRRLLLARDADNEIDSSFIRRHHIQSVVGLPLLSDDTLVGLLYLDFCARPNQDTASGGRPDPELLAVLEREAAQAARAIEHARDVEERRAFRAIGKLAAELAPPVSEKTSVTGSVRLRLDRALGKLASATGFDAVAVYQLGLQPGRLDLVAERGLTNPPPTLTVPDEAPDAASGLAHDQAIPGGLALPGLQLVATYPLRVADQLHGYLLVLSQDRLAFIRKAPFVAQLIASAADLIAGALAGQRVVTALEDTNRVLAALSRMSVVLLQPGATRQQVLEAIVQHVTDAPVPEFDFQFATVYLLDDSAGAAERTNDAPTALVVRLAAGAATDEAIYSTPSSDPRPPGRAIVRVPRWVQLPNRLLSPQDVLAYVAQRWQIVVVGAVPENGRDDGIGQLAQHYPTDYLQLFPVPAVCADGTTVARVPTILIGPTGAPVAANGRALSPVANGGAPFTLDGDVFAASGHANLVRVFVPFGLDSQNRATGVLEAGYRRDHKRQLDRTPIEALRACAAQVAVAVETARLYEEVKRHAEQLEITTDVSRAIASSIDLDQTLRLVARNLARLIDASLCQIALYEEDGSAWYGAAASDEEEVWRRMRGERPEPSFLFDLLDRREPLVIEDSQNHELISPYYARRFGIRSLLALPLIADDQPIGAVVLGQRDRQRSFTAEEVQRTSGLAHQAAIALKNARLHAFSEEEHHIQKDIVLLGFGQWAQRAYQHLLTLKQFINFKAHIVAPDRGEEKRAALAEQVNRIVANGDAFYWDSSTSPAHEQLRRALESSCYVITYVCTAGTHLPIVGQYYDLSNVIVIEKPLGASPEAYREFLDSVDGSVEIVAADHYYFKLEVRLLQLLLTEERTLKTFLDSVEEIKIELLEKQPLTGAAAEIGIIADMIPHAFAAISLFTPIDRITWSTEATPLAIGRQDPPEGNKETYVRLTASFPYQGRSVRLVIVAGKGVENSKWIKLSGERRQGARRGFYKFDFGKGEVIDGTQTNLRAAVRPIREAGVPDSAHLTMLRHVIEKRHPAIGILAIREAMRSNQRIQELEALAAELLARGEWTPYQQGQRPDFPAYRPVPMSGETTATSSAASRVG